MYRAVCSQTSFFGANLLFALCSKNALGQPVTDVLRTLAVNSDFRLSYTAIDLWNVLQTTQCRKCLTPPRRTAGTQREEERHNTI